MYPYPPAHDYFFIVFMYPVMNITEFTSNLIFDAGFLFPEMEINL